jgi:hypothetical protein
VDYFSEALDNSLGHHGLAAAGKQRLLFVHELLLDLPLISQSTNSGIDGLLLSAFLCMCHLLANTIAFYKGTLGAERGLFMCVLVSALDLLRVLVCKYAAHATSLARAVARVLHSISQRHTHGLKGEQCALVTAVVVQRVSQLQLNASSRDTLLPAVFSLIHMCSELERKRVFALLDVEARAAYSQYTESYSVDYMFKGQA